MPRAAVSARRLPARFWCRRLRSTSTCCAAPTACPSTSARACSAGASHYAAVARNSDRLTHKLNLLRAMHHRGEAVRYCIESSSPTEQEAYARERHLIALFSRHDQRRGPLTNQTDGGEGASNPSEESRERRRQSLWGEAEERRAANRWFRTLHD